MPHKHNNHSPKHFASDNQDISQPHTPKNQHARRHLGNALIPTIIILMILALLSLGGFIGYKFLFQTTAQTTSAPSTTTTTDVKKTARITLKGDTDIDIYAGDSFQDPGYSAEDAEGTDVSKDVVVDIPPLISRGDYTITYSYTDTNHETVSATRTVHIKNKGVSANYKTDGLAVLMYHNVYDAANPPQDVDNNFISNTDLQAHIDYFVKNNYYFPNWDEVRDYVDGKIELPEKSVVMTFDDGDPGFKQYGVPLLEAAPVRATAFIITSANGSEWAQTPLKHVDLQSHSDNMHRAGGTIGHGGILTALSHDEIVADLKKSVQILGSSKAFAYPFGDTNDQSGKAVQDAGFLLAFTTKYGKVMPGDNPYYLTRVRVINGESAETLAANV